jgi:hypothetical protein
MSSPSNVVGSEPAEVLIVGLGAVGIICKAH